MVLLIKSFPSMSLRSTSLMCAFSVWRRVMLSSIFWRGVLGVLEEVVQVKRRMVGVEEEEVDKEDEESVALSSPLAIIDRRSCSVRDSCGAVEVAREPPSGS
jgi:hypothetical protein